MRVVDSLSRDICFCLFVVLSKNNQRINQRINSKNYSKIVEEVLEEVLEEFEVEVPWLCYLSVGLRVGSNLGGKIDPLNSNWVAKTRV
jgi:hypothetical protein